MRTVRSARQPIDGISQAPDLIARPFYCSELDLKHYRPRSFPEDSRVSLCKGLTRSFFTLVSNGRIARMGSKLVAVMPHMLGRGSHEQQAENLPHSIQVCRVARRLVCRDTQKIPASLSQYLQKVCGNIR